MTKTDYNKVAQKKRVDVEDSGESLEKHIQPVAKGKVRKPGVGKWMSNVFFGEEGFRGMATHMFTEVIVPSIQNTVADVAISAVQRAIFGNDYIHRRHSGSYWGRTPNNVTRMDSWRGGQKDYTQSYAKRSRTASNFVEEIVFETRQDAQEVFNILLANLETYGVVTVGDFYELSDQPAKFTDQSFGWTIANGGQGLAGARIVAARGGGFKIQFPMPVEV
nr:MAG TPA: hypothetical protein [Caudoviricetes sp.]